MPSEVVAHFPVGGVDKRLGYNFQQPFTTAWAINTVTHDTFEKRGRGGSRYGFSRQYPENYASDNPVRLMDYHAYYDTTNTTVPNTFQENFDSYATSFASRVGWRNIWGIDNNASLGYAWDHDVLYGYQEGSTYNNSDKWTLPNIDQGSIHATAQTKVYAGDTIGKQVGYLRFDDDFDNTKEQRVQVHVHPINETYRDITFWLFLDVEKQDNSIAGNSPWENGVVATAHLEYNTSTGAITAFADYSGTVAGTVKATSAGHGLSTGDSNNITISGSTNFNDTFTVTKIDDDNFYFTDTWVSTPGETGTWTKDPGYYLHTQMQRFARPDGGGQVNTEIWSVGNGGQIDAFEVYPGNGGSALYDAISLIFNVSVEPNTGSITAFADYSGTAAGTVLATSTAHGMSTGDEVTIDGTTNFNGEHTITVVDDDSFYFTDTWVSTPGETGDWESFVYKYRFGEETLTKTEATGTYSPTNNGWGFALQRHPVTDAENDYRMSHVKYFRHFPRAISRRREMAVYSANGEFYAEEFPGEFTNIVIPAAGTLPDTRSVDGTSFLGKYYIADGRTGETHKVYDPEAGTIAEMTASAGSIPTGCRLVSAYNSRLIFAGDSENPHLWYATRQVGEGTPEPDDFDYAYDTEDLASAIYALSTGPSSAMHDPIVASFSFGDDYHIFGCPRSMWVLRGDPGYSGRVDNISREIGIVGPRAHCFGDNNDLYWMSSGGIFRVRDGAVGHPEPVSAVKIPDDLIGIDDTDVVLTYDAVLHFIHVFIENTEVYWIYDTINDVWFPWRLPEDISPTSAVSGLTQGSDSGGVLFGSKDGYIRSQHSLFATDEETDIYSFGLSGPFRMADPLSDGILSSVRAATSVQSGDVSIYCYAGSSAEEAIKSTPTLIDVFSSGANVTKKPRIRGSVMYLGLMGGSPDYDSDGDLQFNQYDSPYLPKQEGPSVPWSVSEAVLEFSPDGRTRIDV